LARGGNRQLNAALHRIAVTQTRLNGPGRDYFHRRLEMGDTKKAALRAMKRRLARVIFNLLRPDTATQPSALTAAA
jgi:transposase